MHVRVLRPAAHHGVGQRAHPLHSNLARVPHRQVPWRRHAGAHARRRPRGDHIPGLQCHAPTHRGQELRNVEDHLLGVSALAPLTVDGGADVQALRVQAQAPRPQCALGDDPRAHGTEGVEGFTQIPLLVPLLHVARGNVVDYRVPKHVVERLLLADAHAPAANHHPKLTLIVYLVADSLGKHDTPLVAHHRRGRLGEDKGH
mmetsp:Transcript_23569/g.37824  ORF Transcript_23569/g.37824 Transcript_23569/m.37824 type:complete len:202 (-) Transcript_23569:582-1187(-)